MKKDLTIVGWREWVCLPELGIKTIKAKVDTGARTSSLHAEDIEIRRRGGKQVVRFVVHPIQRNRSQTIVATAPLIDERAVRSSSGHHQLRPVIETPIRLGGHVWPVEITLTSRDVMGFRMLLGRQAIRRHAVVDPGRSFLMGKVKMR